LHIAVNPVAVVPGEAVLGLAHWGIGRGDRIDVRARGARLALALAVLVLVLARTTVGTVGFGRGRGAGLAELAGPT